MSIISMQSEVSVFSIHLGVYPLMSIAILWLYRLVLLFKTLQNYNGGDFTKTKQTRRVIDVIFSVNTFPLFVLMTLTGGRPAWPLSPPLGLPKDGRPFCVVCECLSLDLGNVMISMVMTSRRSIANTNNKLKFFGFVFIWNHNKQSLCQVQNNEATWRELLKLDQHFLNSIKIRTFIQRRGALGFFFACIQLEGILTVCSFRKEH